MANSQPDTLVQTTNGFHIPWRKPTRDDSSRDHEGSHTPDAVSVPSP